MSLSPALSSSSDFRQAYLCPDNLIEVIRSIPEQWESIAKSELRFAEYLQPRTLISLLEYDVDHCVSGEQDVLYRELLRLAKKMVDAGDRAIVGGINTIARAYSTAAV